MKTRIYILILLLISINCNSNDISDKIRDNSSTVNLLKTSNVTNMPFGYYMEHFNQTSIKLVDGMNLSQYPNKKILVGYGLYDKNDENCKYLNNGANDNIDTDFTSFISTSHNTYAISRDKKTLTQCKALTSKYNGYVFTPTNLSEMVLVKGAIGKDNTFTDDSIWLGYEKNNLGEWNNNEGYQQSYNDFINNLDDNSKYSYSPSDTNKWVSTDSSIENHYCVIKINSPDYKRPLKVCLPWWRVERTWKLDKAKDLYKYGDKFINLRYAKYSIDYPKDTVLCTKISTGQVAIDKFKYFKTNIVARILESETYNSITNQIDREYKTDNVDVLCKATGNTVYQKDYGTIFQANNCKILDPNVSNAIYYTDIKFDCVNTDDNEDISTAQCKQRSIETFQGTCLTYYDRSISPTCEDDIHQDICYVDECKNYYQDVCVKTDSFKTSPKDYDIGYEVDTFSQAKIKVKTKVDKQINVYKCPPPPKSADLCEEYSKVTVFPETCPGSDCENLISCLKEVDTTTGEPTKTEKECLALYPCEKNYGSVDDIKYDLAGNVTGLGGVCSDGTSIIAKVNILNQNKKTCLEQEKIKTKREYEKSCVSTGDKTDYTINTSITETDIRKDDDRCIRTNTIEDSRDSIEHLIFNYETNGYFKTFISKAYRNGGEDSSKDDGSNTYNILGVKMEVKDMEEALKDMGESLDINETNVSYEDTTLTPPKVVQMSKDTGDSDSVSPDYKEELDVQVQGCKDNFSANWIENRGILFKDTNVIGFLHSKNHDSTKPSTDTANTTPPKYRCVDDDGNDYIAGSTTFDTLDATDKSCTRKDWDICGNLSNDVGTTKEYKWDIANQDCRRTVVNVSGYTTTNDTTNVTTGGYAPSNTESKIYDNYFTAPIYNTSSYLRTADKDDGDSYSDTDDDTHNESKIALNFTNNSNALSTKKINANSFITSYDNIKNDSTLSTAEQNTKISDLEKTTGLNKTDADDIVDNYDDDYDDLKQHETDMLAYYSLKIVELKDASCPTNSYKMVNKDTSKPTCQVPAKINYPIIIVSDDPTECSAIKDKLGLSEDTNNHILESDYNLASLDISPNTIHGATDVHNYKSSNLCIIGGNKIDSDNIYKVNDDKLKNIIRYHTVDDISQQNIENDTYNNPEEHNKELDDLTYNFKDTNIILCKKYADCLKGDSSWDNGCSVRVNQNTGVAEDNSHFPTNGGEATQITPPITPTTENMGSFETDLNGYSDIISIQEYQDESFGYSSNYVYPLPINNKITIGNREVSPLLIQEPIDYKLRYRYTNQQVRQTTYNKSPSNRKPSTSGFRAYTTYLGDGRLFGSSFISDLVVYFPANYVIMTLFGKKEHWGWYNYSYEIGQDIPTKYVPNVYGYDPRYKNGDEFIWASEEVKGPTLKENAYKEFRQSSIDAKAEYFISMGFSENMAKDVMTTDGEKNGIFNWPGVSRWKARDRKTHSTTKDGEEEVKKKINTLYMGAVNSLTVLVPFKGDYELKAYDKYNNVLSSITTLETNFKLQTSSKISYAKVMFAISDDFNIAPEISNSCTYSNYVEWGGGVSGAYYEQGVPDLTTATTDCSKSNDDYVKERSATKITIRAKGSDRWFNIDLIKPLPFPNRVFLATLGGKEVRKYSCWKDPIVCTD